MGLSVCLSVKSRLTYGASVLPENAVTYSAGNEGQNIVEVSLKPMRCRDPALPPLYGHTYSRPFFLRKARMRIIVWASPRPLFFPSQRIIISLPPLASLPLPLAAQRNGGKRMCQSGLPADAASLRETGIVDRYTPPVGPCPIE